jgi:protein-tyrosine-phosphatase
VKVLFVCTANICRSAYAEVVARHLAPQRLTFTSAGVRAAEGVPMEELMAAEAVTRGAATANFRSRRLTVAMVDEVDVILTAESGHRRLVLEDRPLAMRKTFTFGQFARGLSAITGPSSELLDQVRAKAATSTEADDVPDPSRRGPTAAGAAADQLDELLRLILPALARASA